MSDACGPAAAVDGWHRATPTAIDTEAEETAIREALELSSPR